MSTHVACTEDCVDLAALYAESSIAGVLDELDRDLVGLVPVKTRIREIAALLLVEAARRRLGIPADPPSFHLSFTGTPRPGQTTAPRPVAGALHPLTDIRRHHVVA